MSLNELHQHTDRVEPDLLSCLGTTEMYKIRNLALRMSSHLGTRACGHWERGHDTGWGALMHTPATSLHGGLLGQTLTKNTARTTILDSKVYYRARVTKPP